MQERQVGEYLNPFRLVDTPEPGKVYPKRNYQDIKKGMKGLNLRYVYIDVSHTLHLEDPLTENVYLIDTDGRVAEIRKPTLNHHQARFFYDELGRIVGIIEGRHKVENENTQDETHVWVETKTEKYTYQGNTLNFTTEPFFTPLLED